MTKQYKPVTKEYKIYVKDKLHRICKSAQEKDNVMAKLKKDKTLKAGDIKIVLRIDVEAA